MYHWHATDCVIKTEWFLSKKKKKKLKPLLWYETKGESKYVFLEIIKDEEHYICRKGALK